MLLMPWGTANPRASGHSSKALTTWWVIMLFVLLCSFSCSKLAILYTSVPILVCCPCCLQVADFTSFCDHAREDVKSRLGTLPPMFVGGHSLGGLISCLTCLKDQSRWAGLLILSPAIDVEWTLSLR